MALCCISPILLARVFGTKFGGPGVRITLGSWGEEWPYEETIGVAKEFGNELVECDVDAVIHDKVNKLLTAPAYMKDASHYEVYVNVSRMVEALSSFVGRSTL